MGKQVQRIMVAISASLIAIERISMVTDKANEGAMTYPHNPV